jgi:SAM-dependent methyltransferase
MTVELRQTLQAERAADLEHRLRRLLGAFSGTEAVVDAGCGTGALAFALAPHVAEVVGVDTRADYLEAARAAAPENVRFLEGDVMALPFGYGEFDVECQGVVIRGFEPRPAAGWRTVTFETGPDDDVDATFESAESIVEVEIYCNGGRPTVAEEELGTRPEVDD